MWWALAELFRRGLLYQGHKIVWWWAQGGTALSSGEVGQGYREVADPSVYVRFPLVDQPGVDLLVWTTTPWTLPSNQFAAVKPDLEYSVVAVEGESRRLIVASALVDAIAEKAKKKLTVERTLRGAEVLGWRYTPPFDYYYKSQGQNTGRLRAGGQQHIAWRVVAAEFVTVDTGTGIVHQGPRLRRSRLRRAVGRTGTVRRRPGAETAERRGPGRDLHGRRPPTTRAGGSRIATRTSSAGCGPKGPCSTRSSTSTTTRSAGVPTRIR